MSSNRFVFFIAYVVCFLLVYKNIYILMFLQYKWYLFICFIAHVQSSTPMISPGESCNGLSPLIYLSTNHLRWKPYYNTWNLPGDARWIRWIFGKWTRDPQKFQVPKNAGFPNEPLFSAQVFPYISRIHTAYIGDSSILGTNKMFGEGAYEVSTG